MKILILIFLAVLEKFVCGIEYGPSLSSLTGVFVNYRGPDLLAIESGRKVRLENYPGYAITLPLITENSAATSEQIFKERGISTVGEFLVEAPKGFGIIVVIQELKLRKTTRDKGNNGDSIPTCSDYIQIGDTRPDNSNNVIPQKICGTVLKDDLSVSPKSLLGPRSFKITSGRVRIAFNHAYVAELVDSLLGSKQKHVLKAELTFTAYKSCLPKINSIINSTTELKIINNEEIFEVCSDYKTSANSTCISSKVLCDEIYNCGGDNETLGSDDSAIVCPDKPIKTTPTTAEDVTESEDNGLSSLATYLGIPSLSSYTNKKYERKFRPTYVSGSSSGSGFLYDYYTTRKPFTSALLTTESSPPGGSIEINAVGPTQESKTLGNNFQTASESDFETEIYSRRELSHAINSVIYGVAVFIIFTIFITVFVVCLTKKIQTTWSARLEQRRTSIDAELNRRRVSTPNILSQITSTDNRRSSECGPGLTSPNVINSSSAVVQELEEAYDPPPPYESLFPAGH